MGDAEWLACDRYKPPEGEVVETWSNGGHRQKLKRVGFRWLLPDGSDYEYRPSTHTPTHWRPITPPSA
jgi:hypothetical protein